MVIWHNGRQYTVSPESCRPAVGFENWTPNEDDIQELRRAEAAMERQEAPVDQPAAPDESEPRAPEVILDPATGQAITCKAEQ